MRGHWIALVLMVIVVLGMGQKQAAGLLSTLFGEGDAANKFQLQRDDSENVEVVSQSNGESVKQKAIPYVSIMPRRRPSRSKDLLSRVLGNSLQSPEMMILDNILRGKQKKSSEKVFSWTNPLFKEDDEMSISRVMGKRGKSGRAKIQESVVQELLVKAMPALKDGEILKMEPLSFKKGIMLSIDYKTVGNQLYTIKARYRPHRKQLDIISLVENLNPFSLLTEDDSDSESEESESQTANNIEKAMEGIQKIFKENREHEKADAKKAQKDEVNKEEVKQTVKLEKKEEKVEAKEEKKEEKIEEKEDKNEAKQEEVAKKEEVQQQKVIAADKEVKEPEEQKKEASQKQTPVEQSKVSQKKIEVVPVSQSKEKSESSNIRSQ